MVAIRFYIVIDFTRIAYNIDKDMGIITLYFWDQFSINVIIQLSPSCPTACASAAWHPTSSRQHFTVNKETQF